MTIVYFCTIWITNAFPFYFPLFLIISLNYQERESITRSSHDESERTWVTRKDKTSSWYLLQRRSWRMRRQKTVVVIQPIYEIRLDIENFFSIDIRFTFLNVGKLLQSFNIVLCYIDTMYQVSQTVANFYLKSFKDEVLLIFNLSRLVYLYRVGRKLGVHRRKF